MGVVELKAIPYRIVVSVIKELCNWRELFGFLVVEWFVAELGSLQAGRVVAALCRWEHGFEAQLVTLFNIWGFVSELAVLCTSSFTL